MVYQPVLVTDISRTGAAVETHFPMQIDSLHDLRLTLGDSSVVVKGRVAHCSISDVDQESVLYRSGVEFVEPSDRVFGVISLEVTTDGIAAVHTQVNPAKLDHATRHWAGGEPLAGNW